MTAEQERAARIAALGYEPAPTEQVHACNLCGSERHVEVSRRDRYGYATHLRMCAACGLGFLSPRLDHRAYGEFYRSVYRPLVSAYHGRRIDSETVQQEQQVYAAELVDFLRLNGVDSARDVLDIGGSTGIVGGAVGAAFGATVSVLDPAPDELAVAAAAGMETIEGFVEDFDPRDRRWEIVLLCQTVDHLLDVAATLGALRRVLAPGGYAFVDVLDVMFMARRRGTIEGAVKVDHPYYLTRDTAIGFFDRAGLAVAAERMSDDGHWGFLLTPSEPREPDWARLELGAARGLDAVWALRART